MSKIYENYHKVTSKSAIKEFKQFSLLAVVIGVIGLFIAPYIGTIGVISTIRAAGFSDHKAVKRLKTRTKYLVVAGIGGVISFVDVALWMSQW